MAGDRNTRIGLALAKVEATIGTDPVPTNTANAVMITEPLGDPGGDFAVKTMRDKLVTGFIQAGPALTQQGRWAQGLQLKTQFRGTRSTTAYGASNLPDTDPLWQAAGFASALVTTGGAETVTYTPASTSLVTSTLYYYVDGVLLKVLGCSVSAIAMDLASGGPLTLDFTAEGLYQGRTSVGFPAGTYGTAVPPTSAGTSFSLWSYTAGIVRSFKLQVQNATTGARPSLGATAAIVPPRVRSRKLNFTVVMEAENPTAKDFEGLQVANTLGAISWQVGGTQYNKMSFSAPNAQLLGVKYSNEKDTEIVTLTGQCLDNAGNDAISVVYS